MTGDAHIDSQLDWIEGQLDANGATRVLLTNHVHLWAEMTLANQAATPAMKETADRLKAICERNLNGELPRSAKVAGLITRLAGLYRDGQRHNATKGGKPISQFKNALMEIGRSMPTIDLKPDTLCGLLIEHGVTLADGKRLTVKQPNVGNAVEAFIDGESLGPIGYKQFQNHVAAARKVRREAAIEG